MNKINLIEHEDHLLTSFDGESKIFLRHYSKGKSNVHFLIVHGAVEHSGRHQDLVQFLIKNFNNVQITVFDNVGHGRSGGTRAYIDSFKNYLEDFGKVSDFVHSKNQSSTKTFILAHSLGGLITLTRILDPSFGYNYPLEGLIFSSPCIRPKKILASISIPLIQKLDQLTPKLHLPMIFSGKDLTRDTDRANDFDTDSLIPKFICVRMAKEIIDASDKIIGLSYYLRIPSLFLVSGEDKIVDPVSTLLFTQGVDKKFVETLQFPQHYHELWNEIDRHDIFLKMKNWINQRLKEQI